MNPSTERLRVHRLAPWLYGRINVDDNAATHLRIRPYAPRSTCSKKIEFTPTNVARPKWHMRRMCSKCSRVKRTPMRGLAQSLSDLAEVEELVNRTVSHRDTARLFALLSRHERLEHHLVTSVRFPEFSEQMRHDLQLGLENFRRDASRRSILTGG